MASFTNVIVNGKDNRVRFKSLIGRIRKYKRTAREARLRIHCRLLQNNMAKLAVIEDSMMFSEIYAYMFFEFTVLVSVQLIET